MGSLAGLLLFGIGALCILGIVYGTIPTAYNACWEAGEQINDSIAKNQMDITQEEKDKEAGEATVSGVWCGVTVVVIGYIGSIILLILTAWSTIFGFVILLKK